MPDSEVVSTHSRLKAAGWERYGFGIDGIVSTHSRLKAAGEYGATYGQEDLVSTHSRLKAAGSEIIPTPNKGQFQHTAA